jgi:hypothetical protein
MRRLRYRYGTRLGVVVAAAVIAIGIAAWLLLGNDNDKSTHPEPTNGAEAASLDRLHELASAVDHPIYWAGEKPNVVYELTVTSDGKIYVRYVPRGTTIGTRDQTFLTVGTYPVTNAYGALQTVAEAPGAVTDKTPDGGFVVFNKTNAQSVYVAYPGSDYQIEVFDPNPKAARQLATSGGVAPIS